MRFSSLLVVAAVAVSINASVLVPHANEFSIDTRSITETAMFEPDSSSDSSRGSSPERERPIEEDSNLLIGDGGNGQLDRLGLKSNEERTAIENEHKLIVKQQLEAFDATRADIEKLAHAKGSTDPNIHITAKLFGLRPKKGGGMALVEIPSKVAGEKGQYHHIYVNPAKPADGLSVVKAKMPRYYAALQRKQGKADPDL